MQTTTGRWGRSGSRLILILSSERSGSTLLRVILGEHSRIVAPAELFLMRYPDFAVWREAKPEAMESLVEYFELLGNSRTRAEIDATCRGMSTPEVYRWLFSFLPADGLLLDKTPAYANKMVSLLRSQQFSPYYIWLIRHPLGVIDSQVRLKSKLDGLRGVEAMRRKVRHRLDSVKSLLDQGMNEVARRREAKWVVQNENIRDFLLFVPEERKSVVHFADLVTRTEDTVRGVCADMGLELEAPMLSIHRKRRSMKPGIGDPNFDRHDRIEEPMANRWREHFSETSLRAETVRLMREIGVL